MTWIFIVIAILVIAAALNLTMFLRRGLRTGKLPPVAAAYIGTLGGIISLATIVGLLYVALTMGGAER